jgi:membrane fusion protein, multidrug efflux system
VETFEIASNDNKFTGANMAKKQQLKKKKSKLILLIFLAMVIIITGIYCFFNGWYFAYCSDAYLRAHIIEIAPRVQGHLISVLIKNNQYVAKGELLMEIDPTPYTLQLNVKKSTLAQQQARIKILGSKRKLAERELVNIKNQYKLALTKKIRYTKLLKDGAVSRQAYEDIVTACDETKNKLEAAKEECEYWEDSAAIQLTVIEATKSEVKLAEYVLSQTRIIAPADGYIVNINARPGDFAQQGRSMFGILENQEWWVKANYKEYIIPKIKQGQQVWIILDLYPTRILEGEVVNIGRAISRTPENSKVIPYVQPTTDWIRLERRFPVRIKFKNLPKDIQFHMGSDARTFIKL